MGVQLAILVELLEIIQDDQPHGRDLITNELIARHGEEQWDPDVVRTAYARFAKEGFFVRRSDGTVRISNRIAAEEFVRQQRREVLVRMLEGE